MNCTTGNINEPVAISKVQSNISSTTTIGSRKCIYRDKSQTAQLPPTTTTKTMATIAEITSMATITEKEQNEKEQQHHHHQKNVKEPIINLDIQMPELHLMGEQMTATAINKKSKTKTKLNALTAAKIKPQQQQKQHDFKELQIYRNKSNQNLKSTTDVQINLPALGVTLEQKKSASDLSYLNIKCRDKRLHQSRKVVEIYDNDHKKYRNYCAITDYDNNDEKFEGIEEFSLYIIFYFRFQYIFS